MRQALAILVSFSLYSPASLLAYNDFSSYNRSSDSYSFTPSQNNWQRDFNSRENFNSNSIMYRPPIQFPKINIDFTFQNTFKSFSSFNSNTFTTKLDLNYNNSFASNSFKPNPVVQNYNFNSPTNYGSNLNLQSFSFQTTSKNFNQASSFQQTRQSSLDITKSFQTTFQSPADFSRLPSGNMNQRSLMLVQPSPATNPFKAMLTSPTNLAAMAQPASNFVQQSFNKFIALPGYNNSPTRTSVTTPKVDPASTAQSRAPTGFFDGVARVVKAVPAFLASIGNKIGEAASSLWNRVVLGHRTENMATLPDGSRLQGQITVNRKDKILSIGPGTVRTVGEMKTLDSGQTVLVPGKEPIEINGEDYLSGNFTYDGENYLLDGPGIKLTNQAGPTIETDSPFKEFVNGDGKGNVTTLGVGAIARNDTFRETSTGLAFRNTNGVWSFDPNQSANLKLDGKTIPVTIDEQGRFKEAIASSPPLRAGEGPAKPGERASFITNVLPNPATSGYEVGKVTNLTGEQTLRTEIPGTKPSLFTTAETNDWRHKTGVILRTKELSSDTNTNAKIHQEGDQYVFTSGHVASVSITEPTADGQKTLYTEAMFGTASRLTVTDPTEFPNYGTTVLVGKVAIGGSGKMDMGKGTIYAAEGQGLRLTVAMNGKETTIPVKSVDMKAGTFVATIPNIAGEAPSEYISTNDQEVKGRIDFENGQAVLINTSIKAPLLQLRAAPGWVETGDKLVGNGYVFVNDNTISLKTDRLINLSDYKELESRKPIWTTTMNDRYSTAMAVLADPTNNLMIRGAGLTLATAMLLPKAVEDAITFTVDCVHPAREFALHSFLVVDEKDSTDKIREVGKAGVSFAEFFFRAEAGATAAVTTGVLAVREGTPVVREAVQSISKALKTPPAGVTQQPARSLGAAARAELADPAITKYEYVRRQQSAAEVQSATRNQQTLASKNAGSSTSPRYAYDIKTQRFRDTTTGKFVSRDQLPYPKNNGFLWKEKNILSVGKEIDRYGPSGYYAGDVGTSISKRGLPPGSENMGYHRYRVIKPFEVIRGPSSPVPEFGASGGGTQYYLNNSTKKLIESGHLKEIW